MPFGTIENDFRRGTFIPKKGEPSINPKEVTARQRESRETIGVVEIDQAEVIELGKMTYRELIHLAEKIADELARRKKGAN
jgi:hypothetical protein